MDSCVNLLASSLNENLEDILAEEDWAENEKTFVKEKLLEVFRDNIGFSLSAVFCSNGSRADVPKEVSIDDLIKQEEAILRVAHHRRRDPKNAAAYLGMTLKKNRKMLKNMKVKIDKYEFLPGIINDAISEEASSVKKKSYMRQIIKDVKQCREISARNSEKIGKLIESYKILRNTENALFDK